jgi:hypothetical protein
VVLLLLAEALRLLDGFDSPNVSLARCTRLLILSLSIADALW